MKVGLKNIKAFEFNKNGEDLFALTGNVQVEYGTLMGGEYKLLDPEIVDIAYDGDGFYTIDGNKITSFKDPADFMSRNIHSDYQTITMDEDGDWRAWSNLSVNSDLYFDEDCGCFSSSTGDWENLGILDIPPDPLGVRFALYVRNEDGSWKRYFKEEN